MSTQEKSEWPRTPPRGENSKGCTVKCISSPEPSLYAQLVIKCPFHMHRLICEFYWEREMKSIISFCFHLCRLLPHAPSPPPPQPAYSITRDEKCNEHGTCTILLRSIWLQNVARCLELATVIIKINKIVKVNLPATGNTHPLCLKPHKIWALVELLFLLTFRYV